MKYFASLLVSASLCQIGLVCAGCGCGSDPAAQPSAETVKESDRLQQIKDSSGGDWNKVSPADKDYLVHTIAHGSESAAKILLGGPKGAKHS